ncbi:MAG: LysM peptidoglycan-binding domain-containing protein [Calditerrivibrio sp.]|nr:LysM peptidoglycan-binding domain-containing protein [Calditerrivibrio sp.]MCA1933555.1 LysM peptidoglycan-binding domain-containing protein [Calditerrivibrio sp.]
MKKLLVLLTAITFAGCANLTKTVNNPPNNISNESVKYTNKIDYTLKIHEIEQPSFVYDKKLKNDIPLLSVQDNTPVITKKSAAPVTTLPTEKIKNIYEPTFDTSIIFKEKKLKLNYTIDDEASSRYNVPISMNSRVTKYIERFTTTSKNTMQKWINNSYKFLFFVKDVFNSYGLPTDLAYLPLAESGFEQTVRSRAGAVGMWQFMEFTGKLYGLKVNYWVDERKDFEKSTYAAAQHLKDLYEKFGDWSLALAAYNAGAGRIQRAIDKFNTEDYFELSEYKHLAEETKDYVPKYTALMMIHKNLLQYGFEYPDIEPIVYEKVQLDFPVNLYILSKIVGIDLNSIIDLNPALRRWITPPNDKFDLKIPVGYREKVELALKEYSPEELLQVRIYTPSKREKISDIAKKHKVNQNHIIAINGFRKTVVPAGFPVIIPSKDNKIVISPKRLEDVTKNVRDIEEKTRYGKYKVKKGDTLFSIAKRNKTTVDEIKRINNISKLKPDMVISLPGTATSNKTAKKSDGKKYISYVVKKGDTVYKLADRYDTPANQIIKINKIKILKPGQTIKIPRS